MCGNDHQDHTGRSEFPVAAELNAPKGSNKRQDDVIYSGLEVSKDGQIQSQKAAGASQIAHGKSIIALVYPASLQEAICFSHLTAFRHAF
jgi:hypothetical protein